MSLRCADNLCLIWMQRQKEEFWRWECLRLHFPETREWGGAINMTLPWPLFLCYHFIVHVLISVVCGCVLKVCVIMTLPYENVISVVKLIYYDSRLQTMWLTLCVVEYLLALLTAWACALPSLSSTSMRTIMDLSLEEHCWPKKVQKLLKSVTRPHYHVQLLALYCLVNFICTYTH